MNNELYLMHVLLSLHIHETNVSQLWNAHLSVVRHASHNWETI